MFRSLLFSFHIRKSVHLSVFSFSHTRISPMVRRFTDPSFLFCYQSSNFMRQIRAYRLEIFRVISNQIFKYISTRNRSNHKSNQNLMELACAMMRLPLVARLWYSICQIPSRAAARIAFLTLDFRSEAQVNLANFFK